MRWKSVERLVRVLRYLARDRRGSQLIEEGMLLGISLVAMTVVATMASNILGSIKAAYDNARSSLDQFLTEVLRDDFNKMWDFVFGGGG